MFCAEISPLNFDKQLQIAVKVIKLLVRSYHSLNTRSVSFIHFSLFCCLHAAQAQDYITISQVVADKGTSYCVLQSRLKIWPQSYSSLVCYHL